MESELIFHSNENRKIFKTENLICCCDNSVFDKIFKDVKLFKLLENESINASVNAFVEGNLNLSIASQKSFVHRNTLIYRIAKIKNTIGLDLKKFDDCVLYLNVRLIYEKYYKKSKI